MAVEAGGVRAPDAVRALLREIVAERGSVLFQQSGGCCDGSSPRGCPLGDFVLSDRDVLLGEIDGAPF